MCVVGVSVTVVLPVASAVAVEVKRVVSVCDADGEAFTVVDVASTVVVGSVCVVVADCSGEMVAVTFEASFFRNNTIPVKIL